MTVTITRLFDDYNAARAAVGNLEAAGLSKEEISIVSNNADGSFSDNDPVNAATETGTGVGVLLGGAAGLLAGTRAHGDSGPGTGSCCRLAGSDRAWCGGRWNSRWHYRRAHSIRRER